MKLNNNDLEIKIELFKNKYINDAAYNKLFFETQKMVSDNKPSLYLISYMFIIKLIELNSEKQSPSKEKILYLLKICRKVNKLKIEIDVAGNWIKENFFNFINEITEKQIKTICSIDLEFPTSEERRKNLLDLFFTTVEENQEEIKNVYPLLKDVIGLEEAKRIIKERVVLPSKYKEVYDKHGVQVGGGILLFGLPGTGKTMFAQAISNELNGHFINIKSSDIKSRWFGETEKRIKEIFDEAKQHKISIIFFDEFEAIGVSRDKLGNEVTASVVVPELLSQMQGFERHDNIMLFVAATNRPWDIDSALLRPGRLDSLVYVDLPNEELRMLMLKNNLKTISINLELIKFISRKTSGYNGADIKNISDKLIRVVIKKEIEQGIKNYEITKSDCEIILEESKSSILTTDYNKMLRFKEKNNLLGG